MRRSASLSAGGSAFDPEAVSILVAAFGSACAAVEAGRMRVLEPHPRERAREFLAKRIIEAATFGERDCAALTEGALLQFVRARFCPIQYRIKQDGSLWRWEVLTGYGALLCNGVADHAVRARAEAMIAASSVPAERLLKEYFPNLVSNNEPLFC